MCQYVRAHEHFALLDRLRENKRRQFPGAIRLLKVVELSGDDLTALVITNYKYKSGWQMADGRRPRPIRQGQNERYISGGAFHAWKPGALSLGFKKQSQHMLLPVYVLKKDIIGVTREHVTSRRMFIDPADYAQAVTRLKTRRFVGVS